MSNGSPNFWVRWRVAAGYPLALIGFYFARPTCRSLVEGAILAAIGLLVRCAAAGIVHKGEQLATSGIYSWARNPLYLGSTILAAGFVLASYSWVVAALVTLYIVIFYPSVIRKEERDLRTRFGAQFDAYSSRVSVFLPWPTRSTSSAPAFSWSQYMHNHEYRALFGTIAALGLLTLRMWLRIRFGF
jgi:protein-S-isoprenylcysteine O-methyltransferase Ste14